MENEEMIERKKDLQSLVGAFPVVVIETFQNWGETQKMKVLSVKPKNVQEVQNVVKAAAKSTKFTYTIRCVGDAHSWSPMFPDEGNILMYVADLLPASGQRITLNEPTKDNPDTTVTIAPGVSTGELSDFFSKNNVCIKSDVILDKVMYGGVIATTCHGVGKDQKSVSDDVVGMSLVHANGDIKSYNFNDKSEGSQDFYNSLKGNLGLFGVMTDITFKVEPMVIVETVNDFSQTVDDIFYNTENLKKIYEDNWSVEIFWFPFNSLSWREVFLIAKGCPVRKLWDPRKDKVWIRKINIVDVPAEPCVSPTDEAYKSAKDLTAQTFGRILSGQLNKNPRLVPSFLKAGFGMVELYNNATLYQYINKAIHYQSFIEVFPVVDMEFAFNFDESFVNQAKAMQVVVEECQSLATESPPKFPLSVAMEMRWIASSDVLMCPANIVSAKELGGSGKTLYLEILGIAGQPDNTWEDFTIDVADEWMKITTAGKTPVPHWAKQWSYIPDINYYIQETYSDNMVIFQDQLTEAVGGHELFLNQTLKDVIFGTFAEPHAEPKRAKAKKEPEDDPKMRNVSGMEKYGNKSTESWKQFWISAGEQLWSIPRAAPRTNFEREWGMAHGLMEEVLKNVEDYPTVDKYLASFYPQEMIETGQSFENVPATK